MQNEQTRENLRDILEYQVRMKEAKKKVDYKYQDGIKFREMKLHKSRVIRDRHQVQQEADKYREIHQ